MFRGNNPASVDDKGRLKIPTAFKALLDEKYGQDLDFFVTSLDGKSVWVYPLPEWIKIEEQLAPVVAGKEASKEEKEQNKAENKARKHFSDHTNYWGQMARADAQGRVLIPALLRESAGMQGEVAVMGQGKYLEVWSHEPLRESMALPFPEEYTDTLHSMGIR
jgi:MraZ protein